MGSNLGKFYLAAKFSRKDELAEYAREIESRDAGAECCARWVFGGEEGLRRQDIAILDLDDVYKADTFILFTHKRGSKQPGGGRFVEMGYALAQSTRCIVIGDYENVFVSHPLVTVYPTLEEFFHNEVPVVE